MRIKKHLRKITFFLFAFLPLPSWAASFDYKPLENIPGFESQMSGDFYVYISLVYKFGIWAVGIAALLMISIGGYMYVTSAGNNSSMEKAKGVITDAVVGLILALTAYLLLYIINPDLVKITPLPKVAPGGAATTGAGVGAPGAPGAPGTLATGCENYASAFDTASGGDKNLKCLLVGIANQESSCNPSATSSHGACGIMQLLPSTAGISCNDLTSNPTNSIQLAANYIKSNQNTIPASLGFAIGKNYSLSGSSVTYGNFKYNTGNDDLIASYNAGSGKIASTPGMKGPFAVSTDCPNPITPAWQCNINPGGYSQTQDYVIKVQAYQTQCLAK